VEVILRDQQLSTTMATTDKLQTYANHLTTSLIPSLQAIRQELGQIDFDIEE
jgi:hypothetical protein